MVNIPESQDLRSLLCSVNALALLTQNNIFSITFYFSFKWRTFLILYAGGFVKQGKVDLFLFKVLFWLLWWSLFAILLGTVPLPVYLRGDFPEGLPVGKVCLQQGLSDQDQKYAETFKKTTFMGIVGSTVFTLYTFFFRRQVKRFLSRLCPNNKMSCIGRYRRNIIDFSESFDCAIFFPLVYINVVYIFNGISAQYEKYLQPETWFYLDVIIRKLLTEVPFFWMTLTLMRRDIPSNPGLPKKLCFYVSKPNYQPRRAENETIDRKTDPTNGKHEKNVSNSQTNRIRHGSFGLLQTINRTNSVSLIQGKGKSKGKGSDKGKHILKPLERCDNLFDKENSKKVFHKNALHNIIVVKEVSVETKQHGLKLPLI